MDVLEGFKPVELSAVGWRGGRASRCGSRMLLQAFKESGHDALAKPMADDELQRTVYNLRHYRKSHAEEFDDVGISARNGHLTLFRRDA